LDFRLAPSRLEQSGIIGIVVYVKYGGA
jgi:hypothetical protein